MERITREKIEQMFQSGYRVRSSMADALGVSCPALNAAVMAADVGFLFDPKSVDIHAIRIFAARQKAPITTYGQISSGIKSTALSPSVATVRACMEAHGETFKSLSQRKKAKLKTVAMVKPYPRERVLISPERRRCEMIRAAKGAPAPGGGRQAGE